MTQLAIVSALLLGLTGCTKDGKEGPAAPAPAPGPETQVSTDPAPADPTPTDPAPSDKQPPPDTKFSCDTLDRAECLDSKKCTMHWIKNSVYECRDAVGACEVELSQVDKKGCEARASCQFKSGSCYCPFPGYGKTQVDDKGKPGGGACACGGGPPSMCQLAPGQ